MGEKFKGRGVSQSIDWFIVVVYLVIVLIGWVNIYASIHSSDPSSIFDWSVRSGKQAVWIGTALVLAAVILFLIPPRIWEGAAIPLYLGVVFLLVVVIFVATDIKGSRSWFQFGPVSFQPAEISKITTSLLLANVMSRQNYKMSSWKWLLATLAVIALPMLIIVGEKETGSALVYIGFVFVLYREGLAGWLLGGIGLAVLLFVLSLTKSVYVALLVAIAVLTLSNALNSGKLVRWLEIYLPILVVMAFFPGAWNWMMDRLIPGHSLLGDPTLDPTVALAIEGASGWSFLMKIKPEVVLLVISIAALPVCLYRSYRDKNSFIALSVLVYILCVGLTFATPILMTDVLKPHQSERIEQLLGLRDDPGGVGYNVNQSKIAIGSGGLFGKGFLRGTQTTYGFVPEQSTDFIFCTVGEEWGFAGCLVVVVLYLLLIMRLMSDAERSRESFTRIYGYCVAACLFMHLFINVGMTIGIMPVIGIPLPLMSYGGSSLWAFTILIFIFLALYREERKYF